MTGAAGEALAALRALVEQAKGVPMTSNVMVSRTELLALIDRVDAAAPDEASQAGASEADEVVAQARAEADRIVAEAQERAGELVGESEVARAADEEARALKLEADTWVDGRLAELETGLHRTLEQIENMRERLHQRSRLDDDD